MFKKQLEEDVNNVFLNLSEFAEKIDLDGQELNAVLEDLEITDDNREGVFYEGVVVYVQTSCLSYVYTPHKSCLLNGKTWYVLESSQNLGLTIIKLYREKA